MPKRARLGRDGWSIPAGPAANVLRMLAVIRTARWLHLVDSCGGWQVRSVIHPWLAMSITPPPLRVV